MVAELAKAAGVTARTINRIQVGGVVHLAPRKRHGHVRHEVWDKFVAALVQRGVELPEGERHGAGARWVQPRAKRSGVGRFGRP